VRPPPAAEAEPRRDQRGEARGAAGRHRPGGGEEQDRRAEDDRRRRAHDRCRREQGEHGGGPVPQRGQQHAQDQRRDDEVAQEEEREVRRGTGQAGPGAERVEPPGGLARRVEHGELDGDQQAEDAFQASIGRTSASNLRRAKAGSGVAAAVRTSR
jgi:hypothetical protein